MVMPPTRHMYEYHPYQHHQFQLADTQTQPHTKNVWFCTVLLAFAFFRFSISFFLYIWFLPVAKLLVHVWEIQPTRQPMYGLAGRCDNSMPEPTISPSQILRIWLQYFRNAHTCANSHHIRCRCKNSISCISITSTQRY